MDIKRIVKTDNSKIKMDVAEITKRRTGLGGEHPLCDTIQLIVIIVFFAAWGLDLFGFFFYSYSTVLIGLVPLPVHLLHALVSLGFGLYLIEKSHKAVFGENRDQVGLICSGVYSWVRHPTYLGTLLVCLWLFFANLSVVSFLVWLVFFIFYDKMATYEEKDLVRIIGEEYIAYQKRVPKWLPKLRSRS
jgi:protein-S-isoprenylcysteine O-methyltransferase Ste14